MSRSAFHDQDLVIARTKPQAVSRYAVRVQPGDVIHLVSGPVVVRDHLHAIGPAKVSVPVWSRWPTGEPFKTDCVFRPNQELQVAIGAAPGFVPETTPDRRKP